jgi:hypothetical protein
MRDKEEEEEEEEDSVTLQNVGTLPHHYTLNMEAVWPSDTFVSYHIIKP